MNIVNEDVLREYFNVDNSDQNEIDFIIDIEKVYNYNYGSSNDFWRDVEVLACKNAA